MIEGMKHCLVTGATGFIGRKLCAALRSRGLKVRASARRYAEGPWDEFIAADFGRTDLDDEILDGVDTVFHLGGKTNSLAEGDEDEAEYQRINVGGTASLLDIASRSSLSRFVLFSSVKAAGEHSEDCMDEAWTAAPTTPYGISKLESEHLLFSAGRSSGFHVCALRFPLVYGRDVAGNLMRMMKAIERGRFPPLPDSGNKRSMVHVDDAVRASLLVAESPAANGKYYIVTDGHSYSTYEISRAMSDALGKAPRRWTLPLPLLRTAATAGDVIGRLRGRRFPFDSDAYRKLLGSAWYSSRKIERELGFRPSRYYQEAIEEMVKVYRSKVGAASGAPKP